MARFGDEQGTALVVTLLFLLVMGVLSTALVFTVQNEMKTSTSYKYSQQSFYQANAAVQNAVQWFADTTNYVPQSGTAPGVTLKADSGESTYPSDAVKDSFSASLGNKALEANSRNSGTNSVDATLTKHWDTQCIDIDTFDISACSVERWRLNTVGYWGAVDNPLGMTRITATIENNGAAFFDRALWGKNSVDLRGAMLIDSYDPKLGVWSEGNNQGHNGAIGSNYSVNWGGNATVYGAIGIGPQGSVDPADIPVCQGSNMTGCTTGGAPIRLTENREFNPVADFPVGNQNVIVNSNQTGSIPNAPLSNPDNRYNSIDVRGDLTFAPGTPDNPAEYFIDTLRQTGQGRIIVSGYTRLYVKTSLTLTGQGILNSGTSPNQLEVFYAGNNAVTMEGGSSAYVEMYAPNADLTIRGNTDFSGSFIANNVIATGGAKIHFSNGALKSPLIKRPFRVITWSQDSF